MRVTDTHVYFWGSYLSNFAWTTINTPFYYPGVNDKELIHEFHSSEQLFMAYKALYFKDLDILQEILVAPDAKSAKALGREVKNFDPIKWNEVSKVFMTKACYLKFDQNIFFREDLLETRNKILVEASPFDKIWGVGLHEDNDLILDEKNWLGENRLGDVLMKVRNSLRKKYLT